MLTLSEVIYIHWPLGEMAWEGITHTSFDLFKKQVDS